MSNEFNPYRPPRDLKSDRSGEIPTDMKSNRIWDHCFWAGWAMIAAGSLLIFVPNIPPGIPLLLATVFFVAALVGSSRYRLRSALSLCAAITLTMGTMLFLQARRAEMAVQREKQAAVRAQQMAQEAAVQAQRALQKVNQAQAQRDESQAKLFEGMPARPGISDAT